MESFSAGDVAVLTLTFFVAVLYASVGHGGASGYLALLVLCSVSLRVASTSALLLNVLVAGVAFCIFRKASHFSWRLTWPFLATSIPGAALGSIIDIPEPAYAGLLAGVLLCTALRLWFLGQRDADPECTRAPCRAVALALGAVIGLASGVVGIGGGIFLSPLLMIFRWATPRQAAATSACFILFNSLAGLLARVARTSFSLGFPPLVMVMVLTAFLGGLLGARLGARHFPSGALRRVLALVLVVASLKLLA